jgi:hypothetical protein
MEEGGTCSRLASGFFYGLVGQTSSTWMQMRTTLSSTLAIIALIMPMACHSTQPKESPRQAGQTCNPPALPMCPQGLASVSFDKVCEDLEHFTDQDVAIRGRVHGTECGSDLCIPTCPTPGLMDRIEFFLVSSQQDTFYKGELVGTSILDLESLGGPACCPAYQLSTSSLTEVIAIGRFHVDLDHRRLRIDTRHICTVAIGS